jgi:hypothetical protein
MFNDYIPVLFEFEFGISEAFLEILSIICLSNIYFILWQEIRS